MSKPDKIIIIAPFWKQPGHVGVYRIDRFIRWLSGEGVQIILVRAGNNDEIIETSWGIEITVRDPLGLYRDAPKLGGSANSIRTPNKWRRLAAYLLFNPDPTVVWAKRAASHPSVLKLGKGAKWVLSSSPPESSHVASASLAKGLNAELIVDMRDGWLDEPLKPLLRRFRLQQWREGRLEAFFLLQAKRIFVTSNEWKELLESRLSFTKGKTLVLTNGYPPYSLKMDDLKSNQKQSEAITLIHAGRFTGSRSTQRVYNLLKPLLCGIKSINVKGSIILVGKLETKDLSEVEQLKPQFLAKGWSLEIHPFLPREEMMNKLCQADGLLLLSASHAAIPSKFFEYVPTGRPILALTTIDSAVWKLGAALPQVYLLDYSKAFEAKTIMGDFLRACTADSIQYEVPPEFSEEHLSQLFLHGVGIY